ncbi:MAG: DNA repair protein rad16 [Caeruleum heppii]|nr:MAG: DNA repair protein rad16 [Caeruleum heppii]
MILAEVAVPTKSARSDFKAPVKKQHNAEVQRRPVQKPAANDGPRSSSISSFGSVVREHSSGHDSYETPGTSTVVTPAEPASTKDSLSAVLQTIAANRTQVSAAERANQLRNSKYSLNQPKRKRSEDDEDEDVLDNSFDARLAQRLQDEENAKALSPEPPNKRLAVRSSRGYKIEDTSDEDPLTSGRSTRTSTPAPTRRVSRLAATKTPQPIVTSVLPSRAARASARKSIASVSKQRLKIEDSDDPDAELTDFDSDEFLEEDLAISGDEDEESVVDSDNNESQAGNLAAAPATPAVPSRTPLVRRRHRGRHGLPVRTPPMSRAQREKAKLQRHHPEVITMWESLAAIPVIPAVQAPQPDSISRQLKSFQLEGLNWMIKQEQTQWKGGLLGDEMGMGKTIQAVSLIMSDYPAKSPTLVIVPPVALMQWQNEIRDYTNGKLKVLVYHGIQVKKLTVKQLRGYDVLMTSYSTLETVHRKERKGWARKDEDGEKILIKEDSPLHTIKYHRVILDEAHSIKSRTSGTAKACFALKADYKWCLSGTPLQNRIGELFSLLRFLEVRPFACYMCKACDCKEIHWALDSKTRQCRICKHRGFDHVSIFNLELLDPIVNHGNDGPGKAAFQKLKTLTDRIMLRRMKINHTESMELPAKDILLHPEFFGEIERDFAGSIMTNTNRQFDTYVAQGVMLNNYANIFGLIMQMRQVANHPDMILRKHAEGGQNVLVCAICDDVAEDAVRSACRHDFCRSCVRNYVKSFSSIGEDPDCPRCHIPLSIDLEQEEREQDEQAVKKSSIINRIKMENWTSSTKIEMLIYELAAMRSTGKTCKSIVFSQFTSMLQLVEWRLRRAGFNTVMLDGTMTPVQRQSSIEYFMKNPDVEIFLVSLKAGGVALNLTEASKVYIVDPWWNPAAEWQSADRCHRIGQGRPCQITRLCIEDSVESRMVLLQEKKANMINGTINADETAMQNLSPQDMQFLFRGT